MLHHQLAWYIAGPMLGLCVIVCRAWLTGQRVGCAQDPPARRHIVGSLIFGLGWGIADACPGPIATQLGQGIAWSLWTLGGVIVGVILFLRRRRQSPPPTRPPPGRRQPRTRAADRLAGGG